jgi:hypothetical protein
MTKDDRERNRQGMTKEERKRIRGEILETIGELNQALIKIRGNQKDFVDGLDNLYWAKRYLINLDDSIKADRRLE